MAHFIIAMKISNKDISELYKNLADTEANVELKKKTYTSEVYHTYQITAYC